MRRRKKISVSESHSIFGQDPKISIQKTPFFNDYHIICRKSVPKSQIERPFGFFFLLLLPLFSRLESGDLTLQKQHVFSSVCEKETPLYGHLFRTPPSRVFYTRQAGVKHGKSSLARDVATYSQWLPRAGNPHLLRFGDVI